MQYNVVVTCGFDCTMGITYRYGEIVWPSIEAAVPVLQASRRDLSEQTQRAGINYTILLSSACFLEGVLEAILRGLLKYHRNLYNRVQMPDFESRRAMNLFYNRIEERIDADISKATGAKYDELFDLLLGRPLSGLPMVAPRWEGINALFAFRNVLAHGREVVGTRDSSPATEGNWVERFAGGYAKVEDYLQRAGVLTKRFFDCHDQYVFLADAIADHFWSVAAAIPTSVLASLEGPVRDAITVALGRTCAE